MHVPSHFGPYQIPDYAWGFATPDGSCSGPGGAGFLDPTNCAVQQLYRIQWTGYARVVRHSEVVGFVPIVFTAVAPEPTTMSLLALSLAGMAAAALRRRRIRAR